MIIIDLSFTQQKGGFNEENVMWNIGNLSNKTKVFFKRTVQFVHSKN